MWLDTSVSRDNFHGLPAEASQRVMRFPDSLLKRGVVAAKGIDELVLCVVPAQFWELRSVFDSGEVKWVWEEGLSGRHSSACRWRALSCSVTVLRNSGSLRGRRSSISRRWSRGPADASVLDRMSDENVQLGSS